MPATLRLTDSGVNAVGGEAGEEAEGVSVGKFFAASLCSP